MTNYNTRRSFKMDKIKTNENISNSIKIEFETLSNSLVECALILSSEDYAKSVIKEREAKKKKEKETNKTLKEDSEKILNIFKEKLKDQIYSTNLPDDKKSKIFNSLISDNLIKSRTLQSIENSIGYSISKIVKKAFCDAIIEVKPELGKMINDEMNFDPIMLTMIVPYVTIPPLLFMSLDDNCRPESPIPDPLMIALMDKSSF